MSLWICLTSYLTISLGIFMVYYYYYFKYLFRNHYNLPTNIPTNFFSLKLLATKTFSVLSVYSTLKYDYYLRDNKDFFKMNLLVSMLWPLFIFSWIICKKFYSFSLRPLFLKLWCSKNEQLNIKEKIIQRALGTDDED